MVRGGGFDWEGTEDLSALSEEERSISYRRGILQGRIDLIRAELVGRRKAALEPEALARVLLGELSGKERGRR